MTLGLSADQISAISAGAMFVFTVGGTYLRLIDAAQAKDIKSIKDAQEKDAKRIDASLIAAWKGIDILKDERHQYITRADHDRWRAEMKEDLAELGRKLEHDLDRLIVSLREELRRSIKEES